MSRALLALTLAALVPACGPSDCEYERIVFQYPQMDTSDTLQPSARAGVGFVPKGNSTLRLSQLTVLAYATGGDTALSATIYTGTSLSDAPDKGSVIAQGNVTLTGVQAAPATFPSVTIPLSGNTSPITLNADAVYFAVLTAKTQPVTLGIATNGAYTGSYQTYGTSGWTASPVSTERVALSLQSPACD